MTQDERLIPAGRNLDRTLAELTDTKPYGKYDKYGSSSTPDAHVREYLFVILKRKWLILSILLVVTSLVTIQVYREPSTYEGTTTIRIEPKQQNLLQSSQSQIIINGPTDPNFWRTQFKLLQNPSLARQVILTLDLQHNPNFLGGRANSGLFNSLKYLFSRNKIAPSPAPAASSGEQPITQEELLDKVNNLTPEEVVRLEPYEDAITASEEINIIEKTNLVEVKYHHSDPALAQKVANTLVDVFANNNKESLESGTLKQSDQLDKQIATYETKVKQERDARVAYAKQYNLPLTPTEGNVAAQSELTYSKQLHDAENDRRKLKAEYEEAKASADLLSN